MNSSEEHTMENFVHCEIVRGAGHLASCVVVITSVPGENVMRYAVHTGDGALVTSGIGGLRRGRAVAQRWIDTPYKRSRHPASSERSVRSR